MRNHALIARLVGYGLIASAVIFGVGGIASGQAPATPPAYRPGMGDFMTAAVQPRHIKLWAAGHAGNWAYAAYALKELGESFDRIVRTLPNTRSMPTADLVASFVKPSMAEVDQAIKAGDAAKFKVAYEQLTLGCNACHEKTERAMVVIQVPDAVSSFPDQNFQPAKK